MFSYQSFKDMRKVLFLGFFLSFCMFHQIPVSAEKKPIPPKDNWGESNDRSINNPVLYQDDSFVYVYSEKQLDNLYIGITDMNWNVVYDETTTVPAGMYYAVSIASLPAGTYYITIMQGSKYIIGMFIKE